MTLTHLGGATATDPDRRRISIWRTPIGHDVDDPQPWRGWCQPCLLFLTFSSHSSAIYWAGRHVIQSHPRSAPSTASCGSRRS